MSLFLQAGHAVTLVQPERCQSNSTPKSRRDNQLQHSITKPLLPPPSSPFLIYQTLPLLSTPLSVRIHTMNSGNDSWHSSGGPPSHPGMDQMNQQPRPLGTFRYEHALMISHGLISQTNPAFVALQQSEPLSAKSGLTALWPCTSPSRWLVPLSAPCVSSTKSSEKKKRSLY